ncbi:hypothetical protein OJ997_16110 [Solirubrobacter phytolaccae]|uniref:Uncharacterized protein n=1 Tax=Solirubrobacter phytolaccae TaxID=1404360 RepID=A0A9X3N8Q3_9ACTN|nr:hypothetical protein [Solirubrobacter phytolaccae]MDA0181828.1 hypothetical protein [Solirubrobacter phytolaccae]
MPGRVLLAALLVALALPASADAAWRLTADGQPLITTHTGSQDQVFVCPPGGTPCVEGGWNTSEHDRRAFAPGETAVGTTFEVRTAELGTDRSPAWQGQVTAATPPAITGPAVARARAVWTAGTWQGGWGDTRNEIRVFACRTTTATGCHSLPAYLRACGSACDTITDRRSDGRPIPDALAGFFLFVSQDPSPSDRRGIPVPVIAKPGPWNDDRPWDFKPEPRTQLSAPLGPIKPAFTLTLRERPFRLDGKLRLGSVTCPARCEVAVTVVGGGKRKHESGFHAEGTKAIAAPYRSGKLTVRVYVDGRLERTIRVVAR